MTPATAQKGLNEACAALRGFVREHPYGKALPPVEELAHRIGQSVKVTRAVLRELDADGEIAVPRRGATRRLRPNEAHPKDRKFVREIRDGIRSGRYRAGTPLPVGLLAHRHGLGARRMARVCRPLLADGLLVNRSEPGGLRLCVATGAPGVDGSAGRIEDYSLLGDQRGSALVRLDGSIDWLCLPRFDSAAVFTRLLGTSEHGFWQIAPAILPNGVSAPVAVRRYVGDTMVLETEWTTESGTVKVTDFMVPGDEAPQVVRIVTGMQGQVTMLSLLRARPGYGRTVPRLERIDDKRLAVVPGGDGDGRLWLDTTRPVQVNAGDIHTDFTVVEGEQVSFALSWREGADSPPPHPSPDALLKHTLDHWEAWVARCTYTGPDRVTAVRSLLTLAALIYSPTGAIVAAPTTSLPEELGGVRNWDYRYAWLRDDAFIASILARFGYLAEALAWKDWLVRACAGTPGRRQIMYGIGGESDLREKVLPWLPGYEGSAPVRIGNDAAGQLQIDVYGEVADALYEIALACPDEAPGIAAIIVELVTELETLWDQPDMGIWEIRGPRRRFTHSAIMAWVAVARAVRLIELGYATGPLERWKALRETIHREVCENGYNAERNTFTQYYGGSTLDASLLHAILSGFLPAEDKRVIGTVEAVQNELSTTGGLVLRYRTEGEGAGVDGLAGDEGYFVICTGWLAESLDRIGRHEEAAAVRERLLSLRNEVGLLAEEYDLRARRQLGNFPQGFSHLAILRVVLMTGPVSTRPNRIDPAPVLSAGTVS